MTIYFHLLTNYFYQMTIHERISLIISTLKMNPNSFSVSIGVNSTIIHNILKGRNAPSYDILNKIALSNDDINMNWVISENGEPFKVNGEFKVDQVSESGQKYQATTKHCDKCKMKDELIVSLRREIETLTEFNTLLKSK